MRFCTNQPKHLSKTDIDHKNILGGNFMNLKTWKRAGKVLTSAGVVLASGSTVTVLNALPALANTISITSNADNSQTGKTYNVYKLFTTEGDAENGITYFYASDEAKATVEAAIKAMGGSTSSASQSIEWIKNNVQEVNTTDSYGNTDVQTDVPTGKYRKFLKKLQENWATGFTAYKTVDGGNTQTDISVDGDAYYVITESSTSSKTELSHKDEVDQSVSVIMATQVTGKEDKTIKLKSSHPDVIKKVEENDKSVGWNDIADYEIGSTVPYEYVSKVPNMASYESYFFAFHDTMDNALTLNQSSVKITIGDKDVTDSFTFSSDGTEEKNGKTYTKYSWTCTNLKAIEGIKEGDTIKVLYNARLNESAATRTGRDGFENGVQIEYSNSPYSDEHGKSKKDVVVVYTYGENVTKVNDEATPKTLKGAEFELYRGTGTAGEKVVLKNNGDGTYTVQADKAEGTEGTTTTLTTNDSGNFVIYGLDQGTYTMKETKAPTGYTKLEGNITVEVKPTYQEARAKVNEGDFDQTAGYVEGTGNTALTQLAATVKYNKDTVNDRVDIGEDAATMTGIDDNQGILSAKIVNKKGTVIPNTGKAIASYGVAAVAFLSGAILFTLKQDKDEDEIAEQ